MNLPRAGRPQNSLEFSEPRNGSRSAAVRVRQKSEQALAAHASNAAAIAIAGSGNGLEQPQKSVCHPRTSLILG